MKKSMFLFLFLAIVANAFSQVAISTNGSLPDASAMLDVVSTEKGLLLPRLTMAERDLVNSPAQGLLIYQTDNAPGFYFYDGSGWSVIGSESMSINGLADGRTGGNSVFLGSGAGASDDGSDNKNVAVGVDALNANTTGSNNTVMGVFADYYNQGGNNNTIIGYEAGKKNSIHNKSGNVFLGYRAGFNETDDNKLYIENSSSTTPLIGGDFDDDEIYLHGDVGIGTTNILERLHIAENNSTTDGTDGNFVLIQNTNTFPNVLSGIRFKNGTSSNTSKGGIFYRDMLTYGRGDIVFVNNSTGSAGNATYADARMTIKNDGKVGIGTTSPGAELEVNGQVKITGGTPGTSKVLTSDADGLASWQPATGATEINGLTDGKTGGNSVFLGAGAGASDDGTNNHNTAVGYCALNNNTTGSNNLANGYSALYFNTEGSHNTANGTSALCFNTTGFSNVAIGVRALYANTDRSNLVAIGDSALYHNGTGATASHHAIHNTAIGSKALFANTTGNNTTAVGFESLYSNTTGHNNTAEGMWSLNSNTTGDYNSTVGGSSLYQNTTGDCNSAIGYSAFSIGTDYSNSTAIGYDAEPGASNIVRIGNSSVSTIGGYANWTNVSDGRFKTNVKENVKGLDFIMKLRPITYKLDVAAIAQFNNTEEDLRLPESENLKAEEIQIGFVAQEVEDAAIALGFDFHGVDKPKNKDSHYGLRYAEFVVPLVKAVQELSDLVGGQQKMIEELKREIEELKKE